MFLSVVVVYIYISEYICIRRASYLFIYFYVGLSLKIAYTYVLSASIYIYMMNEVVQSCRSV